MATQRKVEAPEELVRRYEVLRKFALPVANEPKETPELFPK